MTTEERSASDNPLIERILFVSGMLICAPEFWQTVKVTGGHWASAAVVVMWFGQVGIGVNIWMAPKRHEMTWKCSNRLLMALGICTMMLSFALRDVLRFSQVAEGLNAGLR